MKTIAVVGANGRVGREVGLAFANAGYRVIAVTRAGKPVVGLSAIEHRAADALDRAALTHACRDAQFVFNGLNVPYPKWSQAWPVMAQNVMHACESNNAVHLFPGNIYGHGPQVPELITEDSPMTASDVKGRVRRDIEAQFSAHRKQVQTLIIRAGDFFGGTQRGSWFDLVLTKELHKRRFVYPGPDNTIHAWAYLPDLAREFVALANNAANCQRYETFCFEGHPVTGEQMHQAVEQALGHSIVFKQAPWRLYAMLGWFMPPLREAVKMRYLWDQPHQLSGQKMASQLGTANQTPFSRAIREALTDLDIAPACGSAQLATG